MQIQNVHHLLRITKWRNKSMQSLNCIFPWKKVAWLFFFFIYVARSTSLLHLKPICIYKRSFCQLPVHNFEDGRLTVINIWQDSGADLQLGSSLCDSAALVHHCTVNSTTSPQRSGHTWTRGCHAVNSPTIQLRTHTQLALCQTVQSTETNPAAELENNSRISLCKIL